MHPEAKESSARNGLDALLAVLSEWQRDWSREATVPALGEMMLAHGGSTGTSFAWELQLLGASSGKK